MQSSSRLTLPENFHKIYVQNNPLLDQLEKGKLFYDDTIDIDTVYILFGILHSMRVLHVRMRKIILATYLANI